VQFEWRIVGRTSPDESLNSRPASLIQFHSRALGRADGDGPAFGGSMKGPESSARQYIEVLLPKADSANSGMLARPERT